jgi:predicted TIM-barrel fold metal-dependent hydrolase
VRIDFRVRPPFGDYVSLSIYGPHDPKNPTYAGAEPADSVVSRSFEKFLIEMDDAGIDMAVAMGRQAGPVYGSVPNAQVARMVAESGNRLIGFGGVNPYPVRAAVDEVKRIRAAGLAGVAIDPGWLDPPLRVDHRLLYPTYATCQELGLPVAITMSAYLGLSVRDSDPSRAELVARHFPALQVVVVHAAWPWMLQLAAAALVTKNLWILPDLYLNAPGFPGGQDLRAAIDLYLMDRLLFGSSYPIRSVGSSLEAFSALNISEHAKEKALGNNPVRLLGLADRHPRRTAAR